MSVHRTFDDALSELEDCQRALRNGDNDRAVRKLRSAISSFESIQSKVKRLERDAKG